LIIPLYLKITAFKIIFKIANQFHFLKEAKT